MQHKADTDSAFDSMTILPLGGGQEVGRSCILLQFKGRNILLDCGSHPGMEGSGTYIRFCSLHMSNNDYFFDRKFTIF